MKKVFFIILVVLLLIFNVYVSSEPIISKEKAESIAIAHTSGAIGEVNILSVEHQIGKYIVEWENEENCERGTLHISDQNGRIKMGEHSIC